MVLSLLLLAGVATVTAPADPATGCAAARADEIVVCKRRVDPERYRLPRLAVDDAEEPPRAEWGLGGGVRAGVAVSSVPMPQGAVSQRAMVTLKLPF